MMDGAGGRGQGAREARNPRPPGPPLTSAGAGPPHAPRPSPGFSLVEVVISLAILSVGLVGAMRVFPVGLRASHRSELSSRAGIVAQRTIESLKLVPWEALREGDTTIQEGDFDITTRITQPTVEGLVDAARLKAVHVVVAWTQDARQRELVVVTYLRRPTS